MHATSAIAVAVVAFTATAGALAVPAGPAAVSHGASPQAPGQAAPNPAMPTVTVHRAPRPTQCKIGEVPSAHRKHHKHRHGHRQGLHRDGAHPRGGHSGAHHAVGPRAVMPVPTPAAAPAGHNAPVPTHPAGQKDDGPHATRTKIGANGTATVIVRGTHTPCYAAHATGAASALGRQGLKHKHNHPHQGHGHQDAAHPRPTGAGNQANPQAGSRKGALVGRAVELLERYFDELDALD